MKKQSLSIISGGVVGVIALLLVSQGNPANMGFCIACFLRDTAGALGMHSAAVVQYARPEIIGIVLGALVISLFSKGFKVSGGSAPMSRFFLGFSVMIGALIFLGCPLRAVLRLGGGDLNALVGMVGFVTGIFVGTLFLKKGFNLGKRIPQNTTDGLIIPVLFALLLVVLLAVPSMLHFSEKGPGAQHAPLFLALLLGFVVGGITYKAGLCFVGGFRDIFTLKSFSHLTPYISLLVVVLIGNLAMSQFHLGFEGQPVAHTDHLWNFLGLGMVGFGSVLLGGCPLKQLMMSATGNVDAGITVIGMIVGAAMAHNFGLASSPKGVTPAGKIAFAVCLLMMLMLSFKNSKKAAM